MSIVLATVLVVPSCLCVMTAAYCGMAIVYGLFFERSLLFSAFFFVVLAPVVLFLGWVVGEGVIMARQLRQKEILPCEVWRFSWASPVYISLVLNGLVVALGISASGEFLRAVERARMSEAEAFVSALRASQERYFTRRGGYVTGNGDIQRLDTAFGSAPSFGMRHFIASLQPSTADCAGRNGYRILFKRTTTESVPGERYGEYSMTFDGCSREWDFGACRNCAQDLGDGIPRPPERTDPKRTDYSEFNMREREILSGKRGSG
ncbi:MAG: hypothetical protein HY078_05075 [Elusimicrobia bacterium]|nr:hypothetical protein [Elusimicrobiota bacterium]